MAFNWNEVASAPQPDEIEVTVVGPGFGECVVVHAGQGEWLIVDSCRDPDTKKPVALAYFEALGIDPGVAVAWVVATHWHEDHVAGIDDVVAACTAADFHCAAQLQDREFIRYIARSQAVAGADNAREFRNVFELLRNSNKQVRWTHGGRTLAVRTGSKMDCSFRLEALSPSDREFDLFLDRIGSRIALQGQPHRALVSSDPNFAAIALSLCWGDHSVLLGADLLAHGQHDRGWLAAVSQAKILGAPKANFVKIPHHGSQSAHCAAMWAELLMSRPLSVVTPYNRGPKLGRPPKRSDLKRIADLSERTLLTAPTQSGRARPQSSPISLGLAQHGIRMRTLRARIGIARARSRPGMPWRTELFGRAAQV